MTHRFRLTCWDQRLEHQHYDTYECDDTQTRLPGGSFICAIVGGERGGTKVAIHNDMIVEAIGKTHREDGGPRRDGCFCGYCDGGSRR